MKNKSQYLLILFVAVICMELAACETMGGAGRDIEHAGEAVQDAAD